jgi:hypothetical protein
MIKAQSIIMIILLGMVVYQQKLLNESYGYNDMVYKAFRTCVETRTYLDMK